MERETHQSYIDKIALWLDDELNSADISDLRTHLAQCPACHETYLAVRRADSLLRQAATVLAEPAPGFTARFESRLATYQPRRRWQVWLALGALLLGSFSLLALGAVLGGVTALNLWAYLLTAFDMQFSYYLLGQLGELVYEARYLINLISALASLVTIIVTHPVFWISLPIAAALSWLWVRMLKLPYQRIPTMVDTLV